MIIEILDKNKASFYPVLGEAFSKADFCPLALGVGKSELLGHDVTTFEGLNNYVKSTIKTQNAKVAYGGYGEHRAVYTASQYLENEADVRNIHLGVDLWTTAETPVFAPLDGIVHSFRYNEKPLDYGATIILKHELEGVIFYALYGHLSLKSLEKRQKNELILRGSPFATLGKPSENGGWSPHLHLQLITNLMGWEGDFPGVASRREADFYLKNCPSGEDFCGF